jgi:hypothetical protein
MPVTGSTVLQCVASSCACGSLSFHVTCSCHWCGQPPLALMLFINTRVPATVFQTLGLQRSFSSSTILFFFLISSSSSSYSSILFVSNPSNKLHANAPSSHIRTNTHCYEVRTHTHRSCVPLWKATREWVDESLKLISLLLASLLIVILPRASCLDVPALCAAWGCVTLNHASSHLFFHRTTTKKKYVLGGW